MKKVMLLAIFCMQAMASLSIESVKVCLNKDFRVDVSHKAFPFGYFSRKLMVTKKKCEIKIYSESYKWIKKSWDVDDVCREPVHIKAGNYSVKVLKREGPCLTKGSEYCKSYQHIRKIIQDDGLIFAKGEKEDILSEHGKLYCVYALLNKYLSGEEILSRYQDPGPYQSGGEKEEIGKMKVETISPTQSQEKETEDLKKLKSSVMLF